MGLYVPSPEPLRNCPTLPVWLKRSGQTYLVFLDETYLQFFELNARGYFCHGALGVPENEHDSLKEQMKPLFERYRELLVPELTEIKHTEFKRIPFDDRWELATRIRDVLHFHGCFVSAFYSPAETLVMERLRVELMDEMEALPPDIKPHLERKAAEIKASWSGHGQSDILVDLFRWPISGILHFATAIDTRIKVFTDPRDPKEDKIVKNAILQTAEIVKVITPPSEGRLVDVDTSLDSRDEIGIQIADLIAGEGRAFLDSNRDLQEYGASPRFVTPQSEEPVQAVQKLVGRTFKTGAVTRMPNALQKRFFQKDPKERSVLPCFADLLTSGVVTCFSSWGQPRHLMFYDKLIFNQLD